MAPLPSPTQENQSVLVLNPSIRSLSHGDASHVTAVRGETGTHPHTPSTPLTEVSRVYKSNSRWGQMRGNKRSLEHRAGPTFPTEQDFGITRNLVPGPRWNIPKPRLSPFVDMSNGHRESPASPNPRTRETAPLFPAAIHSSC